MTGMENVMAGGAIGISLTGMAIVFSGLLLISLAITALPRLLEIWARYTEKEAVVTTTAGAFADAETEDQDIASVIGLVMEMEANQHQTPEQQEDIDIANVIGLVLHLEQERQFVIPN